MNYSVRIWNEDDLLQEIILSGKRFSKELVREAKIKCLRSKYWSLRHTCIDLCQNGDTYMNLYQRA